MVRGGHRKHDDESELPEQVGRARERAGGDYFYERDALLVRSGDVDAARDQLGEHGVRVERTDHVEGLGIARLSIRARHEVPAIVDELRAAVTTPLRVSPNHVLGSCSHASAIPVTTPRPAPRRAPLYEEPGLPGDGVRVGVLDTGASDHAYFAGRCEFRVPDDVDEADADGDGKLDHAAGHGTFVAGLVLQHAPRATVVARRVPHEPSQAPRPSCTSDLRLASVLSAHPELGEVDVLSLSLGGYTHDGMGLVATEAALRDYLARNPDLVVVAGAGNDARSDPFFPAAFKFVVGVGALDESARRPACFSNHGWWVDAAAPGVGVHSTFLAYDGELAPPRNDTPRPCEGVLPDPPAGSREFDGWAHWDGTSFAAPQVAAAVAARLGAQRSSADAVYDVLHAPGTSRVPGLGTVVNPRSYP